MANDKRHKLDLELDMLRRKHHLSTSSRPNMLRFPNLDFGMLYMGRGELKQALDAQLRLQCSTVTDMEVALTDYTTNYQSHRLAAVSWFADILPMKLVDNEGHHSIFMPTVNVMDRYIIKCLDLGEDLLQLLKNIHNIRAACLSLSLKMYDVFTCIYLSDLHKRGRWVDKALVTDPCSDAGSDTIIPSSVRGIEEAEKQIILKLKGSVFPANAENTISVLCKYLVLEHRSKAEPSPGYQEPTYGLEKRANFEAVSFFSRTTLDVRLLRFERWKCIAVCCLLGVNKECVTDPVRALHIQDTLMSLLEELKPGEFTPEELSDLTRLLTRACVVCSSSFVNCKVRNGLRGISLLSCCECDAKLSAQRVTKRLNGGPSL